MIKNILELLENKSIAIGESTVLECGERALTYRELRDTARTIAVCLNNEVKQKNKPIAVLIDRNIESIVSFFGVLYSGNFYVPIDSAMPEERQEKILNALETEIIINTTKTLTEELCNRLGITVLDYHTIIKNSISDDESKALDEILGESIDTEPVYSMFTSGSTGVPKGVLVSHRSLIDLVSQFYDAFKFNETCIFGNQAPFDFDVSVKDIYCTIKSGGKLVVIPKELFTMPTKLLDYINSKGINTFIWAVSGLRILSDFNVFDDYKAFDHQIKYVMFSGEVMPPKTIRYWTKYVPEATYVNLYGPTEITCNCTYHIVDKDDKSDTPIPIGKPFKNTRIVLLDENNNPIQEKNKEGELCVEGSSLALGYWNNPEQTAKAFVFRTDISEYPCRIYKTGDIAAFNDAGELVFKSRKDFQIKHMGHRIELGEIEAAINALPFINICCCIFKKDINKIICYYQGDCENQREIVKPLAKALPKYMWPNRYVKLDSMPMNSHAKIDRKKLELL